LKSSAVKQEIAWTYDKGYVVMSNDRGLGAKAIQTRASGFPLVRSAAFTAQMPSAEGVSPAGFAWLNTKGALSTLLAKIPNPALQKLAVDRDPVLVVLNADTEQLRLASRTRITSLVLDLMMTGSAAANVKAAQP
jgi:RecA/RadA recombinase